MMVSTTPISRSQIASRSSNAAFAGPVRGAEPAVDVLSAPFLRGADRRVVHQAVAGEYGVNDQSGLRPKMADVEQTRVGDGGDLLKGGEPVPGERGVNPGPEQRFSVVERCLGGRQFVQPPPVDPTAQQLTQVLAELPGADQVHPSIGASDQ
jgi:hypothetical protein